MIAIVNYGMGNLGSIKNMFKRIGVEAEIINHPEELLKASKILLPGVGSFDSGMKCLKSNNWIDMLNRQVLEEGKPVLGICLGMQLMCTSSEEGILPGLGWVDAKVKKFSFEKDSLLRVPHMGWNSVSPGKESKLIADSIEADSRFYFVHSYYVKTEKEQDQLLTTNYGHPFTAAFEVENLMGVQFHPEKSHRFGMKLFENFSKL